MIFMWMSLVYFLNSTEYIAMLLIVYVIVYTCDFNNINCQS